MHQVVLKRLEAQTGTLLDVSSEYPKVVRHGGLFLVEFGACLEGETRSFPIPLKIGVSGFGEIVSIQTESLQEPLTFHALSQMKLSAKLAKPPMQVLYNAEQNTLALGLLNEVSKRERSVGGILILDPQGHVNSIVVSIY